MNKKNNNRRCGLPVELMNELFASMLFENAFVLLAKMSNGLLARNVQKMINGIKMENKLNSVDCGPILTISDDGLTVKHSGQNENNSVRALLPIPTFNLVVNKPIIISYFEVEIIKELRPYSIVIGFCAKQFPMEGKYLGSMNNSIGICHKEILMIDRDFIEFENYTRYFHEGDFVGLSIIRQPNSKMECFATCNGELLGKATLPQKFAELNIFPAITLASTGDAVHLNFGKEEWQFKDFKSALYCLCVDDQI